MIWGSIPGMAYLIYLLKTSRPALRLYLIGTGFPSPGVKRPGCLADLSLPPTNEVKNEWSYTFLPSICRRDVGKDNFALT
jgi:hypothetical protein